MPLPWRSPSAGRLRRIWWEHLLPHVALRLERVLAALGFAGVLVIAGCEAPLPPASPADYDATCVGDEECSLHCADWELRQRNACTGDTDCERVRRAHVQRNCRVAWDSRQRDPQWSPPRAKASANTEAPPDLAAEEPAGGDWRVASRRQLPNGMGELVFYTDPDGQGPGSEVRLDIVTGRQVASVQGPELDVAEHKGQSR